MLGIQNPGPTLDLRGQRPWGVAPRNLWARPAECRPGTRELEKHGPRIPGPTSLFSTLNICGCFPPSLWFVVVVWFWWQEGRIFQKR